MDQFYWLMFGLTVFGVSIIPGPSTIIAFTHGACFGFGRSIYTAIGNGAAASLQALAASTGLGIVIVSSGTLFLIVKYLGAAYLVYVGVQMLRNAARIDVETQSEKPELSNPRKLFLSGFSIAISNPKAIGFFTALFPQFLASSQNSLSQLLIMNLIVVLAATSVAVLYGWLGYRVRNLNSSARLITKIQKITGGLFIASGLGIAAARGSR